MSILDEIAIHYKIPSSIFKIGIVLLCNFPLAIGFSRASMHYKHLYSIFVSGIIFSLFFNILGFLQLWILALASFSLLFLCKRHYWCPIAVFVLAIGILGANHLYNQMIMGIDSQSMDHTAPMMVLVMKITSFAWSIYDGVRPESELSNVQKRYRITEFPPLIDFLGYIFFFPCFMIGPTFQFVDYNDFIHKKAPFDKIPDTTLPALFTAFSAIVPLTLYIALFKTYKYDFLLTDQFTQLSFLQRNWFLIATAFVYRCRFYVAWKLSESACILTGLGYEGQDKDGRNQWNRTININIRQIEFAENPRMMISAWNINTAEWLRRTIYDRIVKAGTKASNGYATLVTFVISAFWHGFWPGYYCAFFGVAILTSVNRLIRRYIRPVFLNGSFAEYKIFYDLTGWIATHWIFAYLMPAFFLKSASQAYLVYKVNNFEGHIVLVAMWIMLEFRGYKFMKFIRRYLKMDKEREM